MPAILVSFFGVLARFLLSGLIARVVSLVALNGFVLGSMLVFYRNFSASGLDYALSFFGFFGFGGLIGQIQYWYGQLPALFRDTLSYFQIGAMAGFLVNSYISGIFLAWICRRFG